MSEVYTTPKWGVFIYELIKIMSNKNIKSTIISLAIVVVLFGGLIWLSRRSPSTDAGQENVKSANTGILAAEELNFDFGTISMAKGKVSHVFKLKNGSDKPAMISKVYTSCMCTEATLTHGDPSAGSGQVKKFGPFGMPGHGIASKINDVVNAGDEVGVEAVFDPAAHGPAGVGKIDRVVFVETESGLPLQLKVSAVVTP